MTTDPTTAPPRKVLLFSGHMIDAPDRETPRFPSDKEGVAARAIDGLLADLGTGPGDLAICGGACGGDLLFAESARARGAAVELWLPFEPEDFVAGSVAFAGGDWMTRFQKAMAGAAAVHVLPREEGPLPEGADAYERNNVRMLEAAARFGPERTDFIALWNGQGADGPGGTQHLMDEVSQRQGRVHWLDTRRLWS